MNGDSTLTTGSSKRLRHDSKLTIYVVLPAVVMRAPPSPGQGRANSAAPGVAIWPHRSRMVPYRAWRRRDRRRPGRGRVVAAASGIGVWAHRSRTISC